MIVLTTWRLVPLQRQVSPTVTAGRWSPIARGRGTSTDPIHAPTTPAAADDIDAIPDRVPSAPAGWLAGTPHAHPLWANKLQLNDLHDVGVVVLDAPYTLATPATLVRAGYLEDLAKGNGGLSHQEFEVVGYGVFFNKPSEGPQKPTSVADRTRRFTRAVGRTSRPRS